VKLAKTLYLAAISCLLGLATVSANETTWESGQSSPTLFFYELKMALMEMGSPLPETPSEFSRSLVSLENNKSGEIAKSKFEDNYNKFLKLNALFLKLDDFTADYGNKIVKYIRDDQTLTGYHLHLLSKIFIAYHLMGYRTQEFVFVYGAGHTQQAVQFVDLANMAKTKENLMWLASGANMYDKFFRAYDIYYTKEAKLRRILKHIFKTSAHTKELAQDLQEMVKNSLGKEKRKELQRFVGFYLRERENLAKVAATDAELKSIMETIDGNPSLNNIAKGTKIRLRGYSLIDGLANLGESIVYGLSKFFGNMAGSIRWRRGYLENNMAVVEEIRGQLKPLDILFEKTPFALTDTFIPGHFGHAAIWLGSEEELKELGMWDHPSIVPYQDQIRMGKSIVEALRPGVQMNSVRGFSNIDHLAILRIPKIFEDKQEIPDVYTRITKYIGGDYDFNFDIATTDRIVCSELPYHAFGKIKFPTKPRMGRDTIEPDLVAEVNYYDNSPIEFRYYVESFAKTNIQRLKEQDLGARLGFEVNKERSTADDLKYDRVKTTCRTVLRKNTRFAHGSRTTDKRNTITERVCTTKREAIVYKAPDLLAQDISIE